MKRLTKTIMMLSPFSLAGVIWEPPLTEGMREIREGNFDRAAEIFEDAAGGELNQQEAVYGKALCYWFGIGVEQDKNRAVRLLEEDKMSPLNMEDGPEKQAAQHILGLYYMDKEASRHAIKGLYICGRLRQVDMRLLNSIWGVIITGNMKEEPAIRSNFRITP